MNVADSGGGVANDLPGIVNAISFTVIICRSCKTAKIDVVGAGAAEKRRVQTDVAGNIGITNDLTGTIDREGVAVVPAEGAEIRDVIKLRPRGESGRNNQAEDQD